jgi:high-affinity Fe2+/Pb2+ permease
MEFSTYALWSGYAAIALLGLTIIAFVLKWGLRFRLVGATGFMAVLSIGLFGLGLGLFERAEVQIGSFQSSLRQWSQSACDFCTSQHYANGVRGNPITSRQYLSFLWSGS